MCDIAFVGTDEAAALWGTALPPSPRSPIALPAGGRSSSRTDPAGAVTGVPALPVEVREPVGAGDAFAAGWLRGYLLGMDAPSRLRLGHLVAAETLRSSTDHGLD